MDEEILAAQLRVLIEKINLMVTAAHRHSEQMLTVHGPYTETVAEPKVDLPVSARCLAVQSPHWRN